MGYQNYVRPGTSFLERSGALRPEVSIPDAQDFIDQDGFEIDGHGQGESEARPHAR
jgi:hypothetical protein